MLGDFTNLDRRSVLQLAGSAAAVGGGVLGASETDTVRAASGHGDSAGPERGAAWELEKAKADLAFRQSIKRHYIQSISGIEASPTKTQDGEAGTFENADPRASVYLGRDETLDPNFGDKYESDDADDYQDAELQAEYDTSADTAEAYAWDNAGYGTFKAWAYIGREFVVEDNEGEQQATITFRPDVDADMGFAGECGNGAKLEFWVEDHTDNEKFDETVFNYTDYARSWSKSYTDSLDITLEANHGYTTAMKITATTTCEANAGSGVSDFTDYDDGSQMVDVGNIDIEF